MCACLCTLYMFCDYDVCMLIYVFYIYIWYVVHSACLKSIQKDTGARLKFHTKHTKNSQTLKNVADHVIKAVREFEADGNMPTWYLAGDAV